MILLLEKYKALFQTAPWYLKALFMIGLPLLLIGLAYLHLKGFIMDLTDFFHQKSVNTQDQKITQDLQTQQQKSAAVESDLQKLDQQAANIPQEVKNQDPVAFANSRPTNGEP